MAGITFPNVAGTLAPLMQLDLAAERNAFDRERARRADEAEGREREASQYVPAALGGDREALNRVASISPGTAMKLAPLLERMDASKAARVKEDADYITRTGMAILNAPPEQQPQLYARARQEAEASGRNVAQWPTTYDPGWVKFNVDKAMPVAEFYKRSGEGVQYVDGAGGAPAPAGAGGSVIDRSMAATSTLESRGRYGAVGPVANPKGQRAYGKYQIMDFNIGPWTQEVLGTAMTPQQFLASPQAQDAVYKAKFGQYIQKYGSPEAAARAWFAGEGGMNNPGAKDVLGTSVQAYGDRFAQAYGPGATGPQMAQGDNIPGSPAGGTGSTPAPNDAIPIETFKGVQLPPGYRIGTQGGKIFSPVPGYVQVMPPGGGAPVLWPVPKVKEPKEQGTGPFGGNSVEAQALNMLIANGTLTPSQAAELAAGKTITNPADGSVLFMTPSGLFGQKPGQGPQPVGGGVPGGQAPQVGGAPSAAAPGAPAGQPGMIQVTPGKPTGQPTPKELQDIRAARAEADVLIKSLEDFRTESQNASMFDRGVSMTGATTGLNTSYNVAALLAKGEALFNLGVLNGPDLDIIRRTLPDPSTFRGGGASRASVNAAVDKVVGIIKSKVEARERQLGIAPPTPAPTPTTPKPAQGAKQGTYMGPDNKPVSWQEIEATAKNRGLTPDEVVNRLGLQPTGMQ